MVRVFGDKLTVPIYDQVVDILAVEDTVGFIARLADECPVGTRNVTPAVSAEVFGVVRVGKQPRETTHASHPLHLDTWRRVFHHHATVRAKRGHFAGIVTHQLLSADTAAENAIVAEVSDGRPLEEKRLQCFHQLFEGQLNVIHWSRRGCTLRSQGTSCSRRTSPYRVPWHPP